MNSIVILSGPIGAGKTTVSQELVGLFTEPVVSIEGDVFWSFLVRANPGQSRGKAFRMTMASMVAAALPYALHGYVVILDFSIPPWFLPFAQKITEKRKVPIDFVMLLPPEAVCARRASERAEGKIADYSYHREFYQTFTEMEGHTIRNMELSPSEAAAQIWQGLHEGRFRLLADGDPPA